MARRKGLSPEEIANFCEIFQRMSWMGCYVCHVNGVKRSRLHNHKEMQKSSWNHFFSVKQFSQRDKHQCSGTNKKYRYFKSNECCSNVFKQFCLPIFPAYVY
ncbi:hypothetical protein TNCV_3503331 [Trichonephila clavipes]|uniref:Uncharacterized protein n=1 Tax=Trichonephila clavipes TaxID=2585209 RepID=A0A8X6V2Q9_TRICX|nr:hypothetical protein TNCV_3503331 [Trichonephila clavipes]